MPTHYRALMKTSLARKRPRSSPAIIWHGNSGRFQYERLIITKQLLRVNWKYLNDAACPLGCVMHQLRSNDCEGSSHGRHARSFRMPVRGWFQNEGLQVRFIEF